ncbi:MAG: hypothetical protein J6P41_03790, partial [Prevotella sp.]|nr:hypothetical protein [Prevotella sp.]
ITFSAIANFVSRIEVLKSIRRGVYATVEDEVIAAFRGITIDQIRQNHDMILMDSEQIVIKLRLPDKKHRLSKKDGFRLIYLVYKNREEVAFLDIYPKNGPMQQLDIDDDVVVGLVKQYAVEKEQGLLTLLDI